MKYIYLLLFFLSTSIAICQKNDSINTFFAKTVDMFLIRDTEYLINISPLSSLSSSYKSVYNEEGYVFVNYSGPLVQDKNYIAFWTIIDNKLCLYDVHFISSIDRSDTQLDIKNIEDFLKTKFSKNNLPESIKKNERFKNGVIPAVWFSDTLYIKRLPRIEEEWTPDYEYEPFTRLIFKEGRLIGKKKVISM